MILFIISNHMSFLPHADLPRADLPPAYLPRADLPPAGMTFGEYVQARKHLDPQQHNSCNVNDELFKQLCAEKANTFDSETTRGKHELVVFVAFHRFKFGPSMPMTPQNKEELKINLKTLIKKYRKNVRRSLQDFFNETFCKKSPSA